MGDRDSADDDEDDRVDIREGEDRPLERFENDRKERLLPKEYVVADEPSTD